MGSRKSVGVASHRRCCRVGQVLGVGAGQTVSARSQRVRINILSIGGAVVARDELCELTLLSLMHDGPDTGSRTGMLPECFAKKLPTLGPTPTFLMKRLDSCTSDCSGTNIPTFQLSPSTRKTRQTRPRIAGLRNVSLLTAQDVGLWQTLYLRGWLHSQSPTAFAH